MWKILGKNRVRMYPYAGTFKSWQRGFTCGQRPETTQETAACHKTEHGETQLKTPELFSLPPVSHPSFILKSFQFWPCCLFPHHPHSLSLHNTNLTTNTDKSEFSLQGRQRGIITSLEKGRSLPGCQRDARDTPIFRIDPLGQMAQGRMAKGLFIGGTRETLVREDWKPRDIE